MEKEFYKSKTFWGGVFLAVEAGLLTIEGNWVWIEAILTALGTFLTVFGFRDAMR